MKEVKLVAESLSEHNRGSLNENQLNEGNKESLQKFLKTGDDKKFLKAYQNMYVGKKGADQTKKTLMNLSDEEKKRIAKESINAIEGDPKKSIAKIVKKDGKLKGTAMVPKSKAGIHKAGGVD